MRCDRCQQTAIVHVPYSGAHLCEAHLHRSVEKRVRRRIRDDGLIPADASPSSPTTWVIGLSGGKDSAVLTQILCETFADDPRIELHALTVHEGIAGYRDESVEACRTLAEQFDLSHEIVSYTDEFDIGMDELVTREAATLAPCAYCGVLRRDVLERFSAEREADLLLTGHNLDDEAQTAMMNFLAGDLNQMAKHFDASLGPLTERRDSGGFVPRAKPLRDIPEREVALYALTRDLPAHHSECPHASEAFRGEIQQLLFGLEDGHPGTRHSIMAGYEHLASLLAAERRSSGQVSLHPCELCGSLTAEAVCRKCEMLERLSASV